LRSYFRAAWRLVNTYIIFQRVPFTAFSTFFRISITVYDSFACISIQLSPKSTLIAIILIPPICTPNIILHTGLHIHRRIRRDAKKALFIRTISYTLINSIFHTVTIHIKLSSSFTSNTSVKRRTFKTKIIT
jgi:hypothetical protein